MFNNNKTMDIANNLYSWLTKDKSHIGIQNLSDNQILKLANDINSIFAEVDDSDKKITLPRLVVVGTQSSGKSSVLNSIMSMDILPTGQTMTTRTPLDIRLHKSNGQSGYVEFGDYVNNLWTVEHTVQLTIPVPNIDQIDDIRRFIKKKTNELAGPGMNISKRPIIFNIYSPNVPNLSLIDLPGLTMVACTDRGQPKDIKDRIEDLVSDYIEEKNSIILLVMQARSDLETDLGIALVKNISGADHRAIGVLTKPDLMNSETHIGEYLNGKISKNLQLVHGYFVVKNRGGRECLKYDIVKGFELENEYFKNHIEYSKNIYGDKIGMMKLTNHLSKLLISAITEMVPSVMTDIVVLESNINKKIEHYGQGVPESKEGKFSLLNNIVSKFNQDFIDSIESRGSNVNCGKQIKDIFIKYRNNLFNINPFEDMSYNAEYFKNIISSFEGNRMSFHIPPIQILEACMVDKDKKPIWNLKDISILCVDDVCNTIIELVKNIVGKMKYPLLNSHIINIIIDKLLSGFKIETKQRVNEIFEIESDYIWTDSVEFKKILVETSKASSFNIDIIKKLLNGYFKTVKQIIAHMVPKIIMNKLVRKMELLLHHHLYQNIVHENSINLLQEDQEIDKQRNYYTNLKDKIVSIKSSFNEQL